jgi:hypothetical protein
MLDPHQLFLAVVALNGLFASMAWCLARTNWASMFSVLFFAIFWPFVDKPLGGRVVYVIDETNGITEGDFLSVLAVLLLAGLAYAKYRRARSTDSERSHVGPAAARGRSHHGRTVPSSFEDDEKRHEGSDDGERERRAENESAPAALQNGESAEGFLDVPVTRHRS